MALLTIIKSISGFLSIYLTRADSLKYDMTLYPSILFSNKKDITSFLRSSISRDSSIEHHLINLDNMDRIVLYYLRLMANA